MCKNLKPGEPCYEHSNSPTYRNSRLTPPLQLQKTGLLANPLVARYVAHLLARPLLTKCFTSATLSFLQDVISNHVADVPFPVRKDASFLTRLFAALKIDAKSFKMALFGFFVSAPLGHFMSALMIRIFAGRTSKKARLAQLLAQNFIVAPLHVFVYLVSMAIIGGARSKDHISVRVHRGFGKMLGLTWILNPVAQAVATRVVPMELWNLFFSLVNFSIGTYFNIRVKKIQVKVIREKEKAERDACSECGQDHSGRA